MTLMPCRSTPISATPPQTRSPFTAAPASKRTPRCSLPTARRGFPAIRPATSTARRTPRVAPPRPRTRTSRGSTLIPARSNTRRAIPARTTSSSPQALPSHPDRRACSTVSACRWGPCSTRIPIRSSQARRCAPAISFTWLIRQAACARRSPSMPAKPWTRWPRRSSAGRVTSCRSTSPRWSESR